MIVSVIYFNILKIYYCRKNVANIFLGDLLRHEDVCHHLGANCPFYGQKLMEKVQIGI